MILKAAAKLSLQPTPLSLSAFSNLLKQFALATVWAIKLRAMPNNLAIKLS